MTLLPVEAVYVMVKATIVWAVVVFILEGIKGLYWEIRNAVPMEVPPDSEEEE